METSESVVELRKKEEKDNFMENLYAMFQTRKAVIHSQMFFKTGVLKNFLKVSQEKSCIRDSCRAVKVSKFIQNRLQHRCFPVKLVKFLRTPFPTEHLWWVLLKSRKLLIFSA